MQVDLEDFRQYLIRINERLFRLEDEVNEAEKLVEAHEKAVVLRMQRVDREVKDLDDDLRAFSQELEVLHQNVGAVVSRFKKIAKAEEFRQLKNRLEGIKEDVLVPRALLFRLLGVEREEGGEGAKPDR